MKQWFLDVKHHIVQRMIPETAETNEEAIKFASFVTWSNFQTVTEGKPT